MEHRVGAPAQFPEFNQPRPPALDHRHDLEPSQEAMTDGVEGRRDDLAPEWGVRDGRSYYLGPYDPQTSETFGQFCQQYRLGNLATEQVREETVRFSQQMAEEPQAAMKSLLEVDKSVLSALGEFWSNHGKRCVEKIRSSLEQGGTIYIVGAGSSGRVGIQLQAKWNRYCPTGNYRRGEYHGKVVGVMAGGDPAFIRAREGFEDSEQSGRDAVGQYPLTNKDIVIAVSASGSAKFNVGACRAARDKGANVYYLYNSGNPPQRTQALFDEKVATPLLADLGAPAIAGSSRLQPATFALMAIGAFLTEGCPGAEEQAAFKIFEGYGEKQGFLQRKVEILARMAQQAAEALRQGRYVRSLCSALTLADTVVNGVEIRPTFSTAGARRNLEPHRQHPAAAFRSYRVGETLNERVWGDLLARDLRREDRDDALQFLLGQQSQGIGQYGIEQGDFLQAVVTSSDLTTERRGLEQALIAAKRADAKTSVIQVIYTKGKSIETEAADLCLQLPCSVDHDPLRLISSCMVKQVLNAISNGAMALIGKLWGNRMIDVATSNGKLIDRACRLVVGILEERWASAPYYESVYRHVQHAKQRIDQDLAQGRETHAPVKIAAVMMHKRCDYDQAVADLTRLGGRLNDVLQEAG